MKLIQVVEGNAGFDGVIAFVRVAVGAVAVRSKTGPCELVDAGGNVWLTASTLSELCYRMRAFGGAGPFNETTLPPAAHRAEAAWVDGGEGLVTDFAAVLFADAVEELSGVALVAVPRTMRRVATRAQVLEACGPVRLRGPAPVGSFTVFFPDGRAVDLYPDKERGWSVGVLFKVAAKYATLVHLSPTRRAAPRVEVARSALTQVCVFRIGETVGTHVVRPGGDEVPPWDVEGEEQRGGPLLDVSDRVDAAVRRAAENYGEDKLYNDWSLEQRARTHERVAAWPTADERRLLRRIECERLGVADPRLWDRLEPSAPLVTPQLTKLAAAITSAISPATRSQNLAPVQRATGLVAFVGRCVFGVPGADDLRELFADRRKSGRRELVEAHLRPDGGYNPYTDMLLEELAPLDPVALGTRAGILWGRQLGRLLVSLSAGLAAFSKTCESAEPGTPMLVHVDEILSLIPLDLQHEHFGPTFAIFAALARSEFASTCAVGKTLLRLRARAADIHPADAWAYAVLVAVEAALGMWRPAVVLVPPPFDYLPALLALDGGARYASDRKYEGAAIHAALEMFVAGRMPAQEK